MPKEPCPREGEAGWEGVGRGRQAYAVVCAHPAAVPALSGSRHLPAGVASCCLPTSVPNVTCACVWCVCVRVRVWCKGKMCAADKGLLDAEQSRRAQEVLKDRGDEHVLLFPLFVPEIAIPQTFQRQASRRRVFQESALQWRDMRDRRMPTCRSVCRCAARGREVRDDSVSAAAAQRCVDDRG